MSMVLDRGLRLRQTHWKKHGRKVCTRCGLRAILALTRKGRCLKTPLDKRCNLPDSEVLSRLNTWAAVSAAPANEPKGAFKVLDWMVRVVTPGARLIPCFQHPVHQFRLKTEPVVSSLDKEQETMTTVTYLASRRAAPTPAPITSLDTIQLHAQALNALASALHYLRRPGGDTADLNAATARAVRAATLLKRAATAANTHRMEG